MMKIKTILLLLISLLMIFSPALAKKDEKKNNTNPLAAIPLRNIGPALISGRISDFAFVPGKKHEFYVTTASGNIWKTTNNTITWKPVFDHEGSYSIGTMEIDPSNPLTLWVGTGENNGQRSVAYGDGVYKSTDGGKTWKNMGLKKSGHISQIWINPKDSDMVLVAAQGPLWNDGGDRGLYKTTDGGKTWNKILSIDKYTGVNEFVVDPRNPDNIVASSWQRRRHVWVLINGGPGSGIHRTTDGGKTWNRIQSKLPKDHMGRIGLIAAPSKPDRIYAIVESNKKEQGFFMSDDFGQSFSKQSGHMSSSPQYYNELVVDPHNPDRVYSLSTFTNVSEDAGKTWTKLSDKFRHVDDHALWVDPDNTDHLFIGGDGGVYETYDRGQTWRHIRNLPLAQFYRISPDNAEPFYNVCGGTQDNNSLCGPSRTTRIHGVTNADWDIVVGGDGYKAQIDPKDPNTVYAQYQYGGLARVDRRTDERIYIAPQPGKGENAYKWNWNTPLIISPHSHTRLYYGAEKLFQSDDRGDSWKIISPDLTQQIDRNQLKVMGRIWSVDSVAKNKSTSMYGSLIGISESPVSKGQIIVGSDDGVVSITTDDGKNWNSFKSFPGVPDMSYISDVLFSSHDKNTAYITIDNHKRGDFKPYVLKTENLGKSWKMISSNLPERGSVHTIVEDHMDSGLLFVGTEFGLFFTQDGGSNWNKFSSLPTTAVRDLEIQRRENDLVVASFGRGVYILDDYSPLRTDSDKLKAADATLFPIRDSWLYIEGDRIDDREKGSSGSDYFTAKNPPYGVTFSYYLSKDIKPLKEQRREKEIALEKDSKDTPYPSWEKLRKEDNEQIPNVYFEIRNKQGQVVSHVSADGKKGFHRSQWNMRLPATDPVKLKQPDWIPYWASAPMGPLATPGTYTVTLIKKQNGITTAMDQPRSFVLKRLNNSPELSKDPQDVQNFQIQLAEMSRTVKGINKKFAEMNDRVAHLYKALDKTPKAGEDMSEKLDVIRDRMLAFKTILSGDSTLSSREEPVPWTVATRIGNLYGSLIESQSDIPQGFRDSYEIARTEISGLLDDMKSIEQDLIAFEKEMEKLGAPWTPGRMPEWNK